MNNSPIISRNYSDVKARLEYTPDKKRVSIVNYKIIKGVQNMI